MINFLTFKDSGLERTVTIETDDIIRGFHWLTADQVVLAAAEGIANKLNVTVEVSGMINVTIVPLNRSALFPQSDPTS